jgi:hypothetical protein
MSPKSQKDHLLVEKTIPQETLDANKEALESYGIYRKTSGIIDRVNTALGRKATFKSSVNSTLNASIDKNVIKSTTNF